MTDKRSAEQLVESVKDYAWKLASQYCRQDSTSLNGYDKEDFFQAAMFGAWKAALTFDRSRGTKFITHADYRMSAECRKLYREAAITHIPSETFRLLPPEERTKQVFHVRSLATPLTEDGSFTLADTLAAEVPDEPGVHREQLFKLLSRVLKPRELGAVMVYYGFAGDEKTLADLAKQNKCSRQAEHQHLTSAVAKLRKAVRFKSQSAFLV